MLRKLTICLLFIGLSASLMAQKKKLEVDEPYKSRSFYPKTLAGVQWIPATEKYSYVINNKLITCDAHVLIKDTVLDIDGLDLALKKPGYNALSYFPDVKWINASTFTFINAGKLLSYNLLSRQITALKSYDSLAENIDVDYTHYQIAYTKGNNLYIATGEKQTAVTSDTCKGIVNGQKVHRNEFAIDKGTFWSPHGNKLAFYRMDETMVTDYPLVDIDTRIASLKTTKYPMAGMKSHHVTIGVYDTETGKTVFLKTGKPEEQYLTNITWSPDEKYIYIAVLNRDQNHLQLNRYLSSTGDPDKTLFEENDEKYIEPLHGPFFLPGQPSEFIWFSARDGYNHLYLYNTDGRLIRQITHGNWPVITMTGYDKQTGSIVFTAAKNSPIEENVCSVSITKGTITTLSQTSGSHEAWLSENGKYIIDAYSSFSVPYEYQLIETSGKHLQNVFSNENPLKKYEIGKTTVFTIKAEDSTDLYCRMIKPPAFDSLKKYPVIIYVYGGPHSQLISNSWMAGAGFYLNYLATKGYIVFSLDNRGTSNRGKVFEQAIFRNLGSVEVEDQMQGVKYLTSLPYVDKTRLGVHGWSYGGFMTISMMLKNPGVFKVGVAGGPVIDWKYYEVMYGERYMDTPEDNPDGYEAASLLNYVDNLQGKLLIIHGTMDPTVVWQNSLSFLKKCVEKDKFPDYFVYPGHEHNVSGKDRIHLYKLIENYFNEHL